MLEVRHEGVERSRIGTFPAGKTVCEKHRGPENLASVEKVKRPLITVCGREEEGLTLGVCGVRPGERV